MRQSYVWPALSVKVRHGLEALPIRAFLLLLSSLISGCGGGSKSGLEQASVPESQCYFAAKPFKSNDPQQCFGAIGSRCTGVAPLASVQKDTSTCMVAASVSVGSILHDRCCYSNPNGKACQGYLETPNETSACTAAWNEAAGNSVCELTWRAPFGPYTISNPRGNDNPDGPLPQDLLAPDGQYIPPPRADLDSCHQFCGAADCIRDEIGNIALKDGSDICGKFARCGVCKFALSTNSLALTSGSQNTTVGVIASPLCPAWTVSSSSDFIAIIGSKLITGNGQATFLVAENLTSSPRTGTLKIAGQVVIVTQDANPAPPPPPSSPLSFRNLAKCAKEFIVGNWYAYDGSGIYSFATNQSAGWYPTNNTGNGIYQYSVYVQSGNACVISMDYKSSPGDPEGALRDLLSWSTFIAIDRCEIWLYPTTKSAFDGRTPIRVTGPPQRFFGSC